MQGILGKEGTSKGGRTAYLIVSPPMCYVTSVCMDLGQFLEGPVLTSGSLRPRRLDELKRSKMVQFVLSMQDPVIPVPIFFFSLLTFPSTPAETAEGENGS